ncbi:hypothetical protein FQ192_06195 [Pseudomonas sp. ANT_J12]|nr:hypothetical protein FQ192_06195 [Pseudomonas sp. ANT_J12]
MIVPTLRVGMPPGTLRVPLLEVTQSVTGCIPTRSVGTIGHFNSCRRPSINRRSGACCVNSNAR